MDHELEPVYQEAAAELGLEPRGLRGHELPGVRDREELLGAGGIERQGEVGLAGVHEALELLRPPDAPYEPDVRVAPGVLDPEDRPEEVLLEAGHVEPVRDGAALGLGKGEPVPRPRR
jgi:hypothetical protein